MAAGVVAVIPSATIQAMAQVVSLGGGTAMNSLMEGWGRPLNEDGALPALVLKDTVVPATDELGEVPPMIWSRESTRRT